MCWCELCRLWWPHSFRLKGGGVLRQHIEGRGKATKSAQLSKFKKNVLKMDHWTIYFFYSPTKKPSLPYEATICLYQDRATRNKNKLRSKIMHFSAVKKGEKVQVKQNLEPRGKRGNCGPWLQSVCVGSSRFWQPQDMCGPLLVTPSATSVVQLPPLPPTSMPTHTHAHTHIDCVHFCYMSMTYSKWQNIYFILKCDL